MPPRLDTQLSRALLDASRVEPAALERAIQEQLVHGGALDTLLLEMGLVDEPTLSRLLATAWGTEAVDPARVSAPEPAAVQVLPERMAVAMRVCPLWVGEGPEGASLHILVTAPHDRALVAELSTMLQRPLVAHVVPEVRVWQGLARAYGTVPDERFVSLLASLGGPLPRKPTPRTNDELRDDDAGAPPAPWDLVEAFAQLAAQDSRDGIIQVAVRFARRSLPFAAMIGVRTQRDDHHEATCHGWLRSGPADGVQFTHAPFVLGEDCLLTPLVERPSPLVGRPAPTPGNQALFGWLGRRRPRTFVAVPVVVADRAVAFLVGDAGVRAREFFSLTDVASFGARLGPAFEALLRQRHRQHPSLFPLPTAVPPPADPAPTAAPPSEAPAPVPVPPVLPPRPSPRPITISMPAVELAAGPGATEAKDGTSPFARAYVPPTPAAPPPLPPPPSATVAPWVRVASSLAEALPQLEALSEASGSVAATDHAAPEAWRAALAETVARGHQAGTVQPEQRPRLFLDDEGWEPVVLDAAHAAALRARGERAPVAPPPVVGLDPTTTAPPEPAGAPTLQPGGEAPEPTAEQLLEILGGADEDASRDAHGRLLGRGPAVLALLQQHFPGRLRRDPFDPTQAVLTPARVGPMLELLAAFGAAGLDVAIPHLDSRYPAHRLCAVLMFVHTPDPRAVDLLRPRLHDQEPLIQRLAADALAPFVAHPQFAAVLNHLRERVGATSLPVRRRAVELLGAFRDVAAVPTLMSLLERSPELARDVRTALRLIALQDHGERTRMWDAWWQKAKKKTRVDWLIEGLGSDDRELRGVAIAELSAMAGDDFGFHPDADKLQRKAAQGALSAWWDAQRRASG